MKRNILFGFILVFSGLPTTQASVRPLYSTVSNDGQIEILNAVIDGRLLPGYRFYGGSWRELEIPEGLSGSVNAISGNGDVISGWVKEPGWHAATDSFVKRASAWRRIDTSDQVPVFDYYELSLLTGHEYSLALDVSENGDYIIGYNSEEAYSDTHACYWNPSGEAYSLGTMTYDSFLAELTYPYSVSNNNIIVGTALSSEAVYQVAFIWDQTHGMRYLKDVLEADYGYDFSGCILSQAYNISSDGRTIDGYGYDYQGEYFDFMVTIPEPATVFLLGLGGLALRRRQH